MIKYTVSLITESKVVYMLNWSLCVWTANEPGIAPVHAIHYIDVIWASRCLKSAATPLFVQQPAHAKTKIAWLILITGPFWGKSTWLWRRHTMDSLFTLQARDHDQTWLGAKYLTIYNKSLRLHYIHEIYGYPISRWLLISYGCQYNCPSNGPSWTIDFFSGFPRACYVTCFVSFHRSGY